MFERGKEFVRPSDAVPWWPADLMLQAVTFVGELAIVIETVDGQKVAGVLDKVKDDAGRLASFADEDQILDIPYARISRLMVPQVPPADTGDEVRRHGF